MTLSRQIVLRERPVGAPSPANFRLESVEVPAPVENEVQVRNLWMSVDPYMRRRLYEDAGYAASYSVGLPLEGAAVGEVTLSKDPEFPVGTLVQSSLGWRERCNATPAQLRRLDTGTLPPEVFLAEAGTTGLAAYIGMVRIADVKAGESVFVSAAAGAVGLVACQIALARGCHVVGSAGGRAKCDHLEALGVHRTIDYQATPDLTTALRRAADQGIDAYFDNVGGSHLQAALEAAKPFARFALCGMISQGSGKVPPSSPPPNNLLLAITKRITLRGFLVADHAHETDGFLREMSSWIASGRVKPTSTVRVGLESAADALLDLFRGANTGKMLVKLY